MLYAYGFICYLLLAACRAEDGPRGVITPRAIVVFANSSLTLNCSLTDGGRSAADISFEFSKPMNAQTRVVDRLTASVTISNVTLDSSSSSVLCKMGDTVLAMAPIVVQVPQFPKTPTCTANGDMLYCSWRNCNNGGLAASLMYYTFNRRVLVAKWNHMPKRVNLAKKKSFGYIKYWGARVASLRYFVKNTCGSSAYSDTFSIDLHQCLKPSPITRIRVEDKRSGSIMLGWTTPSYSSSIRPIVYRLTYGAEGHPTREIKTRSKFAQLPDLEPNTNYTISIDCRATNGTSEIGHWSSETVTNATTLSENAAPIPPELHEILTRRVQDTSVVLSIIPHILVPAKYRFRYTTAETVKELLITESLVRITNLTANAVYRFDVDMYLEPVNGDAVIWSNVLTTTIKTRSERYVHPGWEDVDYDY